MKNITINFARGLDRSVDPRVAPNGTLARVQNLRLDLGGRMALRNGYQSLGTTVHDGGTQLVPFDLHEFNGSLVCLGNHSPANQTGIRAPYVYEPYSPKGNWRTAVAGIVSSTVDNTAQFIAMPAADAPRIVYSDQHTNPGTSPEFAVADVAAIGTYVCIVSHQIESGSSVRVEIVDTATGNLVHEAALSARAPRVIACGNVFLVFSLTGGSTQLQVQTFDITTSSALSAATNINGVLTANFPLDVAPDEGSTAAYFVIYATGTGATWERRLVSTHAVQSTAAIVTTANSAVSICGALGETVNVITCNAGVAQLRTYAVAGGAPTLGPTALFASGVVTWVAVTRLSSTQVYCVGRFTGTPIQSIANMANTTGAHAVSTQTNLTSCTFVNKPLVVDGIPFVWAVLGNETNRPYGLLALQISGSQNTHLASVVLQGQAKQDYSTTPGKDFIAHMARGSGSKTYAALVAVDPRDQRLRMNLLECEVFSGARRQAAGIGTQMFLAGGNLTQFDGLTAVEVGFDTGPAVDPAFTVQSATGSLTLLGTYQYEFVFRSVDRNDNVTLSAPSAPVIVTLTGANNAVTFRLSKPFSLRNSKTAKNALVVSLLDVFRTEAGGSIPRLVQTVDMAPSGGNVVAVTDTVSDTVQQTGAKLYTQGDSGAVSGRLPLALAGPCRYLAVSDGKLWIGGKERQTEVQLSIEKRPGEACGFADDDLFFVENSENVTALAIATDGRRLVFGADGVSEVQGQGPNAAGIGDLSDPIAVDSPIGCNDWRSVVRCEHGVLFRAGDSKIMLLPRGGGAAIDAAAGIRDILEAYPVTTGAVRHDADQLVTFTLANTAGTDGRIVHLDLQTSGFDSKRGWVASWIVDRCALFEAVPDIQVLSDTVQFFEGLPTSLSVTLPVFSQAGDRLVVLIAGNCVTSGGNFATASAGWVAIGTALASTGYLQAFEKILAGATTLTLTQAQPAAAIVRVLHLRGAHGVTLAEFVSNAGNGTGIDPPALTPSWGSAKNLWIAACCSAAAQLPSTSNPVPSSQFTTYPSGFGSTKADRIPAAGVLGNELATCRQVLQAASLDAGSFFVVSATDLTAMVLAIRPAGTAGTPIRAPEQYQRRLVVCNSTDVLLNTAGSFADQGNLFISPEYETATIYAMGPGGAARHRKVVFVGEFRGRCVLGCELSYDDGLSYTELSPFILRTQDYAVGQTVRLTWVPRRRKVEGVRARFRVTEDAGTGPSEGLVFHEAVFEFEELVGASRQTLAQRR